MYKYFEGRETNTQNKKKHKQFKNETHMNIIPLWPNMNVCSNISWDECVG